MTAADPDPAAAPSPAVDETAGPIRLDKWLWHARFAKSRGVAAGLINGPGVRINGTRAPKPATAVRPGDVLTFAQGRDVRVVRVLSPGARRGPAPEARLLYEDLAPPPGPGERAADPTRAIPPRRDAGAGRPTKAERRALDRLRPGPEG